MADVDRYKAALIKLIEKGDLQRTKLQIDFAKATLSESEYSRLLDSIEARLLPIAGMSSLKRAHDSWGISVTGSKLSVQAPAGSDDQQSRARPKQLAKSAAVQRERILGKLISKVEKFLCQELKCSTSTIRRMTKEIEEWITTLDSTEESAWPKIPWTVKRQVNYFISCIRSDQLPHSCAFLSRKIVSELDEPRGIRRVQLALEDMALSREQARAVLLSAPNNLVTARAGSGKTRTLVAKARYLVEHEKVDPNDIMVLTFNRDAAREVRQRFINSENARSIWNVRTFHSLAYRIVQPHHGTLLFDENNEPEDFSDKAMTQFVQKLIRDLFQDEEFRRSVAALFDQEYTEAIEVRLTEAPAEYRSYRENLSYVALDGVLENHVSQKYLRDFLFLSTIEVEDKGRTGGEIAIHQNGLRARVSAGRPDPVVIGEVVNHQFRLMEEGEDRISYFKYIGNELLQLGFEVLRRSDDEICRDIVEIHEARLTQMFTQFIQQAKTRSLTTEDIRAKLVGEQFAPYQTAFTQLATKVMASYQCTLEKYGKLDFYDLLVCAIREIDRTRGEVRVEASEKGVKLNQIAWVLIDEFQDFSELFYRLIQSIRTWNPGVRLYCVGDDWQAINGFAGSDLRFFKSFDSHLGNFKTTTLSRSYRCPWCVARCGNRVMDGHGPPMRSQSVGASTSTVYVHSLSGEYHPITETIQCVKKLLKMHRSRDTIILCRTREVFGWTSERFLAAVLTGEPTYLRNRVKFSTVHGYKGQESDHVIIINACRYTFPKVHPDTSFYEPLGRTISESMQEERRLFYVALTRAREFLNIITFAGRESMYLQEIRDMRCVRNPRLLQQSRPSY